MRDSTATGASVTADGWATHLVPASSRDERIIERVVIVGWSA